VLRRIQCANPQLGPVFLSKIDIAVGFYQVWLKAANIPKLAVLFPSRPDEETLIGLPLTLPMGWKELPPLFYAATKTVADLANSAIKQGTKFGPHRLDQMAETTTVDDSSLSADTPPILPPIQHCHKPLCY
jgi:hypothetical protein